MTSTSTPEIDSDASPTQNLSSFLVRKRDGRAVAFDPQRITSALIRAGQVTGEFGEDEVDWLTQGILKVINHRFDAVTPVDIEEIQNIAEQILINCDYIILLGPTSPIGSDMRAFAMIDKLW
ncbi:ATP cone domain-containing protein [Microbulbifer sp. CnH-101-E]|uniref:ATP cone domain-containing protein n=1 Tax=unclassified Microbulbifer TaxID=2619833 RepID=UPI00403916BA